MIHGDTALRQNFLQVAVGNAIPDIEETSFLNVADYINVDRLKYQVLP
jgi:hypothetical protein